jgi:hypothetical protein
MQMIINKKIYEYLAGLVMVMILTWIGIIDLDYTGIIAVCFIMIAIEMYLKDFSNWKLTSSGLTLFLVGVFLLTIPVFQIELTASLLYTAILLIAFVNSIHMYLRKKSSNNLILVVVSCLLSSIFLYRYSFFSFNAFFVSIWLIIKEFWIIFFLIVLIIFFALKDLDK